MRTTADENLGWSYFSVSGVPLAYRTLLRGHHRQRVSITTQRPWDREHKDHRTSVHIPTVSHAEQHYLEEDFINSQTSVQELSTREATITFHVTENTTQREKRKLVSSDGYTYVDKKENKSGSIVLRCSVRNSKTTCPATVLQHGDTFTTNSKTAKNTPMHPNPGIYCVEGRERGLLRGIRIHGCAFHWGQAVWRHVQEAGVTGTSNFV